MPGATVAVSSGCRPMGGASAAVTCRRAAKAGKPGGGLQRLDITTKQLDTQELKTANLSQAKYSHTILNL